MCVHAHWSKASGISFKSGRKSQDDSIEVWLGKNMSAFDLSGISFNKAIDMHECQKGGACPVDFIISSMATAIQHRRTLVGKMKSWNPAA